MLICKFKTMQNVSYCGGSIRVYLIYHFGGKGWYVLCLSLAWLARGCRRIWMTLGLSNLTALWFHKKRSQGGGAYFFDMSMAKMYKIYFSKTARLSSNIFYRNILSEILKSCWFVKRQWPSRAGRVSLGLQGTWLLENIR
jgi:hypothetical protein